MFIISLYTLIDKIQTDQNILLTVIVAVVVIVIKLKSPCVCFVRDFGAQVLAMLFHWVREQQGAGPGAVQRLMKALVDSGRRDLAEEVEDIVTLGKRKYEESLKRVGLERAASSADPQSS